MKVVLLHLSLKPLLLMNRITTLFVVAGGEAVVEAVEAVVVTLIYSARCAPRLVTVL
jgi:hypothetical protein